MARKDLHLPAVPVEHLGALVPGPLPDDVVRNLDERGLRHVAGPEAVPGKARDLFGREAGALGGFLDQVSDLIRMQTFRDSARLVHGSKQRARLNTGRVEPSLDCPHRTGLRVDGSPDADFPSLRLLIGLTAANGEDHPHSIDLDIVNLERGGFRPAQCGRK